MKIECPYRASHLNLHSNLVIFEYLGSQLTALSAVAFTFQSGDIRMKIECPYRASHLNLHSNLVIFEYLGSQLTALSAVAFTFQSGDIRIYIMPSLIIIS